MSDLTPAVTTRPGLPLEQNTSWFRRWWKPGIADLLFLLFAVGIIQRSQGSMLDDPGLGWHLRNIDAMIAHGGWLMHDPFTVPIQDWPWRTNQWLGDLLLRGAWSLGGLEGIAAVTTIVLALTFRIMYRMLIRDRVAWPLAAAWTYLALLGTSLSWVARPNMFTILFVMITARICDRFHRGECSTKSTWWLAPMFAIWVNTHGGFVAGLMMMVGTCGIELALAIGIPHRREMAAASIRAKHWAILTLGCAACTLLNPYGWTIYPWIFQLLGNEFFMNLNTEWQSPDFHALGAFRYELLILLLPLVLTLSRRRPSLVALGLSVLWLHFAFTGQRYVCLWVVVTVPMLARLSGSIPMLKNIGRHFRISDDIKSLLKQKPARSGWAVTAVACLGLLTWAHFADNYSRHDQHRFPTAALRTVIDNRQDEVVFHDYNWGGWLTWHGYPNIKTWIDDRNEVHGRKHIELYFDLMQAAPGWQEQFARYKIGIVCIRPESPLAKELDARPQHWETLFRDEHAVVYRATKEPPASLVKSGT